MPDIRDFCERLWNGEIDTVFEAHPATTPYRNREAEEVADGVLYYKNASSVNTLDTGDSLVMLDTGLRQDTDLVHSLVRRWRPHHRLVAAVFSHHHVDHVFGVGPFDREAEENHLPRPVVYGHERKWFDFCGWAGLDQAGEGDDAEDAGWSEDGGPFQLSLRDIVGQ